jgi:hypothetical protein
MASVSNEESKSYTRSVENDLKAQPNVVVIMLQTVIDQMRHHLTVVFDSACTLIDEVLSRDQLLNNYKNYMDIANDAQKYRTTHGSFAICEHVLSPSWTGLREPLLKQDAKAFAQFALSLVQDGESYRMPMDMITEAAQRIEAVLTSDPILLARLCRCVLLLFMICKYYYRSCRAVEYLGSSFFSPTEVYAIRRDIGIALYRGFDKSYIKGQSVFVDTALEKLAIPIDSTDEARQAGYCNHVGFKGLSILTNVCDAISIKLASQLQNEKDDNIRTRHAGQCHRFDWLADEQQVLDHLFNGQSSHNTESMAVLIDALRQANTA